MFLHFKLCFSAYCAATAVPILLEIKIISSYSEKGTFSNWGSVLFIASFMIGSSSAGVRPWKV